MNITNAIKEGIPIKLHSIIYECSFCGDWFDTAKELMVHKCNRVLKEKGK